MSNKPSIFQKKVDRYCKTRSKKDRDILLEAAVPLVESQVNRLLSQMPPTLRESRDDLMQAGCMRLLEYIDRYDSNVAKFSTWSTLHIRGALYDYVRQENWASRGILSQLTIRQKAVSQLTLELGRSPNEEDIAQHLPSLLYDEVRSKLYKLRKSDPPKEDVIAAINAIVNMTDPQMVSFEKPGSYETDSGRVRVLGDTIAAPENLDDAPPENLTELMRCLNVQSSTILYLYYVCGVKLRSIGEILNLSESRVSQLRSSAIRDLRQRFPDRFAVAEAIYVEEHLMSYWENYLAVSQPPGDKPCYILFMDRGDGKCRWSTRQLNDTSPPALSQYGDRCNAFPVAWNQQHQQGPSWIVTTESPWPGEIITLSNLATWERPRLHRFESLQQATQIASEHGFEIYKWMPAPPKTYTI